MYPPVPIDVMLEILRNLRSSATEELIYSSHVGGYPERWSSTLLNAALSCRAFLEPALDTLWHDMDSLLPLFKLLPSYEMDGPGSGFFTGPILAEDSERYLAYATRIKAFQLIRPPDIRMASLIQISRVIRRVSILPSLRHLFVNIPHPCLPLLAPPFLQSFAFKPEPARNLDDDDAADLCALLDVLSTGFTSLRKIDVDIDHPSHVSCLIRIPRLTTLYMAGNLVSEGDEPLEIKADEIRDLASSSTLIKLQITGMIVISPIINMNLSVRTYPVLTEIYFVGDKCATIPQATSLLQAATFPSLKTLQVGAEKWENGGIHEEENWRIFFRALAKATTQGVFDTFGIWNSFQTGQPVNLHWIAPNIAEIRTLKLSDFTMLGPWSRVRPVHITRIVQQWPTLTDLAVTTTSKLGFAVLIKIAKLLPNLVRLEITIDCTDLVAVADVPILNHQLSRLRLQGSALEDSVTLACSVDKIFPWLDDYNICGIHFTAEPSANWNQVEHILRALQSARKDERSRFKDNRSRGK